MARLWLEQARKQSLKRSLIEEKRNKKYKQKILMRIIDNYSQVCKY